MGKDTNAPDRSFEHYLPEEDQGCSNQQLREPAAHKRIGPGPVQLRKRFKNVETSVVRTDAG
jgi:hypothetical protein